MLPAPPTNQPSTTGKNLISLPPDSTAMDDALFVVIVSVFCGCFEKVIRDPRIRVNINNALNTNSLQDHVRQDQFKKMDGRPGKEMSLLGMICPFAG